MYSSPFDTVAAVSTPYGKGGVAVIRVSGEDAVAIAERIFRPAGGRPLSQTTPRTAVYGEILDPREPDRVLDDGLCTVFRAPRSFTGEDTVEIACHGGVLVTRHVLEACFAAGARQATAGEFTRRAYLGGKLDMEKAEALGNLLDAGNDEQLRLARAGMNGLLAGRADALYADLCGVMANMEAGIDFPEEDLTEMTREELRAAVLDASREIDALAATYRTGHAIAEGVPTVICGRPNVGKSAFYNRLVGRDAAIVTDIAGTTRDVLTDTVSLGRVTLRLSDTAGLRESDDPVEQIGITRARRAVEEAELVFVLLDPRDPSDEDEVLLRELAATDKTVIRVYTKRDLGGDAIPADSSIPTVYLSSVTGEGFDALREAVESAFIDGNLRMGEEAVVFSARQSATLSAVSASLALSSSSVSPFIVSDIFPISSISCSQSLSISVI